MRRLAGVALAAALVIGAGACGGDTASEGQASPPSTEPAAANPFDPRLPPLDTSSELPPNDIAYFKQLYDPYLASVGLEISYGKLQDPDNGYRSSPTGTHLALYAIPTGDYTLDQYLAGMWTVTAAMTRDVFARWSGLETWDICQLPVGVEVDPDDPPPSHTQIALSREQAERIDWENGDLVDLLVARRLDRTIIVNVAREVRESPAYQAADAAARTRAEAASTTTTAG